MKLFVLTFLAVSIWAQNSSAIFLATDPGQLRAGVPTDVFVVGDGDDHGDLFLRAAILAAKVSRDRFPQRQRVIISAVSDFYSDQQLLSSAGFKLHIADSSKLDKSQVLKALKFPRSALTSLQFFVHSNPQTGIVLHKRTGRLAQTDSEFAQMGGFLARNAIVIFHSCNSGWFLAPAAAKLWGRSAFGTFTADDFQEPMSDGKWYYHDAGRYPEHLSRIGNTTRILRQNTRCGSHECLRLKPVNGAYSGVMGRFAKGLGFYKGFARTEAELPQAMIHYALLMPSVTPLSLQSSRAEILTVVKDWMCPSDKSGSLFAACSKAIDSRSFESNSRLNFFSGTPVSCSTSQCYTVVKCSGFKAALGMKSCKTVDIQDKPSTVFSDQMKLIMKGIQMFEKGQIAL
ncbi:hypothetical protein EZJ49_07030 [Bdellovibrio bacteriovorus]|uniref:hypothetical protein n=1 Tax=Bdellovibrio bacteriovorus TaxID=959 RepID=UPI0021D0F808|nr:hypothetical protein [Bdellovibrio bacteriovorus]UXR66000.1 hypothetical protein EZJ49_07030 [Bdellovibrio bacteriovorus]